MPVKKWTIETVAEVAKQYKTRKDFQYGNKGAYLAAIRGKFIDEVCAHMERQLRKAFTKEFVSEIAKKFRTRQEFQDNDRPAYNAAINNGWNDVFSHMELLRKERTKDDIRTIAQNYRTRTEFAKGSWADYLWAKRRGWLDEVCEGMEVDQRAPFSKDEVHGVAKQFATRSEFQRAASTHYNAALNKGWLPDVCSHMRRGRSGFNPDKGGWLYHIRFVLNSHTSVYKVGITNTSIDKRIRHMCVPKHIIVEVMQATWYENGADAKTEEKRLLTLGAARGDSYQGDAFLDTGNTELFYAPLM